ncbi:MAG TPA: MoaD/ThiS family protein [Myxococcota bacterium]|nr:MoaD/ThiS family protein [Myxococcota bacterium]
MAKVRLTRHLQTFFPQLRIEDGPLEIDATSVQELVQSLDRMAPGVAFYLCDELGRMRPHVNIFIGDERIRDRRQLSDPLTATSEVTILQALSGG